MENSSTLDPRPQAAAVAAARVPIEAEQAVQPGGTNRSPQTSVSAALAAAAAEARASMTPAMRFPPEDSGQSLAEMAHRDLDAALQLLASRAQYITGANGAAIALRRQGKNDMLCRASTGSNAPELGALLSTEFGLSGESVRTRQPLRCDDAERDARVNREVCQQLGIASVVVMPVVNDDEVLGVFELFSGKANAFGERDLSALQRLSEMVETAVKLARAAESIPQQTAEMPAGEVLASEVADEDILEVDEPVLEVEVAPQEAPVIEAPRVVAPAMAAAPVIAPAQKAPQVPTEVAASVAPVVAPKIEVPAALPAPKKPLFWSAALDTSAEADKSAEADQSHVPPILRNLKKCEACGFPVSAGRALCVECEEKKWRGQLRTPRPAAGAAPKVARPVVVDPVPDPVSAPVARLKAAASATTATPVTAGPSASEVVSNVVTPASSPVVVKESKGAVAPAVSTPATPPVPEAAPVPTTSAVETSAPAFVLSAGLEPSQSWLSRNKYVVGAIVLVAAAVAGIFLLR
jgi:GAF domain-containing protein